ncbi:MAG: prolyl oligopeptidase family serine peptidase [Actinomycetota bacterium]
MTAQPYGSWPSPISAALVAAGGTGVGSPAARDDALWWAELRPSEGGRVVLVAADAAGEAVDRLPAPWSARTRVHEYGGGAWWFGADRSQAFFAEWSDQRLYRLAVDGPPDEAEPIPVTPEPAAPAAWRYADGREHPDGGWLVCVREDHHGIGADGGRTEPANELVAIEVPDAAAGEPAPATVLVTGPDFVASPRFSPDGRWLSWVQWDHPNMPWDATTLCAAPVFANRRLGNVQVVAGGDGESIHGADWTSDGRLVFSGDRNGFWNLHAWRPGDTDVVALTALDGAEIGGPVWNLGLRHWCELDDGRLAVVVTTDAVEQLAVIDGAPTNPVTPVGISTPEFGAFGGSMTAAGPCRVAVVAAGPRASWTIATVPVDAGSIDVVRPPDDIGVDRAWFSAPEAISFPSEDRTAHAFFYPPAGVDVSGPDGEAPPLIVMGHGGPTANALPVLNYKIQYWTSRGFAVVDVNYGGSTGFGRAYRRLLNDAWGVVDVADCINAARHLADQGLVDGERLLIRGGSAGGFTVLTALIDSDRFAGGTSLYWVADLTALAADTHKFESRYLDGLVGPYPERRDRYEARSPINRTEGLSSPLLVLQGTEDEIVPPSQSEAIVAALAAKGVPHAYVAFEGEQHGFRRAENVIRSLEVELWFYGRILGFEPADTVDAPAGAVGLG